MRIAKLTEAEAKQCMIDTIARDEEIMASLENKDVRVFSDFMDKLERQEKDSN